jgi:glutamine amidotransferase-like uncharacterized protein
MKIQISNLIVTAALLLLHLSACVKPSAPVPEQVSSPAPESVPSPSPEIRTDVLIYGGPGSWKAEVESLKEILYAHGATYEVLGPEQIDQLPVEQLLKYRLLLIAGGDAPTVRKSLSVEAHFRIREAVQKHGLNYLGFCAGAWLAVAPAPLPNEDVIYGLGVVEGPVLQQNYLWKNGRAYGLDQTQFPDGAKRQLLWYGGPITPNISAGIIAKYADGTPAITQIWSGKGFVILSGLHPAANKKILNQIGIYNREAIAPELAWALLNGAIHQIPLSTF